MRNLMIIVGDKCLRAWKSSVITRRELITAARKGTGVCLGYSRQKEKHGEMQRQEAVQVQESQGMTMVCVDLDAMQEAVVGG